MKRLPEQKFFQHIFWVSHNWNRRGFEPDSIEQFELIDKPSLFIISATLLSERQGDFLMGFEQILEIAVAN